MSKSAISSDNRSHYPTSARFEDRSRLRELLATRRMELLETVMEEPPESIRAFAEQIDRDVREVHHDLHLFFNRAFLWAGPSEAAVRPYETVRIEVEFGTHSENGSTSTASV